VQVSFGQPFAQPAASQDERMTRQDFRNRAAEALRAKGMLDAVTERHCKQPWLTAPQHFCSFFDSGWRNH
jgi:hypothetical protein